jgi:hypothetical protein
LHTDGVEFINYYQLDSITGPYSTLLRAFDHQFNGIFVLNSEHEPAAGPAMGISKKQFQTAHGTMVL